MTTHSIKKGFDIRIAGAAETRCEDAPAPAMVGVQPPEFLGIKTKVEVSEGDKVKTGDLLFFDKKNRDLRFLSPATGTVSRVVLGARRAPQLVEIELEGDDQFADIPRVAPDELPGIDRAELVARLRGAGLWPLLRQRPVGKIPAADAEPVAIYVNGMDTEPLAADPAIACMGLGKELQAGVEVMRRLTSGKVYLTCIDGKSLPDEFQQLQGVEVHRFGGPHPAGLVGTHISRIQPLKAGELAFYLKAQELALIGHWALTGQYPAMRTVAVVGSCAPRRQYFRVRQGAPIASLTGGAPLGEEARVINGTVLNGEAVPGDSYLGFYAQTLTCMPEGGDTRDLFGWALPQFGKHSASRAVMGWVTPKQEYDLDARLHGGPRPIVNIGAWEKVMPLDIYPTYLVRAIQANDLEEAINLGLLEVTEEDVALCTFADPCKIEVGEIIRQGLDLYEREG